MNRNKHVPFAFVLDVFSLLIALLGIVSAVLLIIYFKDSFSLLKGIALILGSMFLAAIFRVLGKRFLVLTKRVEEALNILTKRVEEALNILTKRVEEIAMDSKSMHIHVAETNAHVAQIKAFFEQIEKHLDLKK